MFTYIQARCTIKIFTINGVLIDKIDVDNVIENRRNVWDSNSQANGTVQWYLHSKEGLEIAAGYYIYYSKSQITGDVKIGILTVIK